MLIIIIIIIIMIIVIMIIIIIKICLGKSYPFKLVKDCLPQSLLGPFLNALSYSFFPKQEC